jgi:hypothetical protein
VGLKNCGGIVEVFERAYGDDDVGLAGASSGELATMAEVCASARLRARQGLGKHPLPDIQADDINSQAGHFNGFGPVTPTRSRSRFCRESPRETMRRAACEACSSRRKHPRRVGLAGSDALEDRKLEALQHSPTIASAVGCAP